MNIYCGTSPCVVFLIYCMSGLKDKRQFPRGIIPELEIFIAFRWASWSEQREIGGGNQSFVWLKLREMAGNKTPKRWQIITLAVFIMPSGAMAPTALAFLQIWTPINWFSAFETVERLANEPNPEVWSWSRLYSLGDCNYYNESGRLRAGWEGGLISASAVSNWDTQGIPYFFLLYRHFISRSWHRRKGPTKR